MPETEEEGRRYGRRYWRGGPGWSGSDRRPPWWPAGETWPPTGWQGPPWRRMRGRFLARVAIFATLLVFIAVGGATLVFLLLASALGAALPAPNGALLAVLAILVALLLGASVRRAAAPIGDLIEAAGRVEAGDYSVRVPEHGAREIRGLARAFNQMAERLEQDAVQRRRLLADVSHELRTPLTPILGAIYKLRTSRPGDEDLQTALEMIERNAKAQARIVEELLDISRITTGKLDFHRQPADLLPIVESAIEVVRPSAEALGIHLHTSLEEPEQRVWCDRDRIQQVILNLLSNAIKFTRQGGTIEVRLESAPGRARIRITDTGVGISEDFLPHIFERFRQAGSFTTRLHGGLGVGLAIVRYIVERHGGTVRAESSGEGHGTTLIVDLPYS